MRWAAVFLCELQPLLRSHSYPSLYPCLFAPSLAALAKGGAGAGGAAKPPSALESNDGPHAVVVPALPTINDLGLGIELHEHQDCSALKVGVGTWGHVWARGWAGVGRAR